MAWPLPSYFRGLEEALPDGRHVVMIMVAASNVSAVQSLAREHRGAVTLERRYAEGAGSPPLYEYTWNHTTLQALKVDKTVTYLQTIFPLGANVEALIASHEMFGEEVMAHAEFQRRQGRTNCSSLQVVRYTSDERLWEIVRGLDTLGIKLSNPHSYILEDKGARVLSADLQLAFKREADPQGLLNPGKMSRWTAA
jgi:FAD/FMN-containing dehydrogenase